MLVNRGGLYTTIGNFYLLLRALTNGEVLVTWPYASSTSEVHPIVEPYLSYYRGVGSICTRAENKREKGER